MKKRTDEVEKSKRVRKILNRLHGKTDPCFTCRTFLLYLAELIPLLTGVIWQLHSSPCMLLSLVKKIINTEYIKDQAQTLISVETAYMGAAIAGTVFFLTVMDSGRIGIPYGKIMNYHYGSRSVPI